MSGSALMLQGTGSDVGKSVLTAAFCRIAHRRGLRVAPFKPQNMSNNAAACPAGGEIGRAQALQALACGIDPHPDMNPVLLKPQSDRAAQVVVQGRVRRTMEAHDYMGRRDELLSAVIESFERLVAAYDLVFVEGAGSPAEVNLRARDIANMGFARRVNVPVCLIGDIDKGGVIASVVGTKEVMDPKDAALIEGVLINKFRGDPSLFEDGLSEIVRRTGWRSLGVVPWLTSPRLLPAEDAVGLERVPVSGTRKLKIAAPMLSRLANFDDADPLRMETKVEFQWVEPGKTIPRDADVIVLFGTKSTLGDLEFLRAQGWDHDIIAHARGGGQVFGICGGYQMLGHWIRDPGGVDGGAGSAKGLGLLDVETVMTEDKRVASFSGKCSSSQAVIKGYEIHVGTTTGRDTERPLALSKGIQHGACSRDGRVSGFYIHGAFTSDEYRRSWIEQMGGRPDQGLNYNQAVEAALDSLADEVEASVDVDALFSLAREPNF